jgi:hypothetical protein
MAAPKTITITWRDENYGPISGTIAFRSIIDPAPSESKAKEVQRAFKATGFEFDHRRASWIAKSGMDEGKATTEALIEKLELMGLEIFHKGATADYLEKPKNEAIMTPTMRP